MQSLEYADADAAKAPRWALFRHQFDLRRRDDSAPYLSRWWIVKTPWGGIALHRICGPDARFDLHDHPWNFWALVLRGGYSEIRLNPFDRSTYRHRVRRFNRIRMHEAHYINSVHRSPTWTLLFIGRKRRKWGFWTPIGSVRAAVGHELPKVGPAQRWQWTAHDAFDTGHYADHARARME